MIILKIKCNAVHRLLYLVFLFAISVFIKSQNYYNEKYRPQFHFTPEKMWMNDPNGLVFHNGTYHFFYQHYPEASVWGPMHWGHATSKDLLHWKHEKIALFPDELGMIFSGSTVVDKNNSAGFGKNALVSIYTSHNIELEKNGQSDFQYQSLAYSTDNGNTWTKYAGNPVLPNSKKIRDFRDPKVIWNENNQKWQMVLAAGHEIQFYESDDLKNWTYLSTYKDTFPYSTGVWECPDLFEMQADNGEKKWILIISHGNETINGGSGTRYFVGDWDGKTFTTKQTKNLWLDYGSDNYAGVTYSNTKEKILIGWMSNWQYATTTPTEVWRSAATIPRDLSLHYANGEYELFSNPVKAFDNIAKKNILTKKNILLSKEFSFKNSDIQTSEINVEINGNTNFNMTIGNENNEFYAIRFDSKNNELIFDRSNAGQSDFNPAFKKMAINKVKIEKGTTKKFRILTDKSSVETFVDNGKYVITDLVFPNNEYNIIKISGKGNLIKKINIKKINKTW